MEKIIHTLKTMSILPFVLLSVVAAEVFTAFMSVILRGRITYDYLITGGVVSLGVSSVVTYLFKLLQQTEIQAANFSKTILNSMHDAVSVIDVKDLRILQCNEAFLKEFGPREEDVIRKKCCDVVHKRGAAPCGPDDFCPARETIGTGEYAAKEHVHYTKNGEKKYIKISTNPVKNKAGDVVQVVCSFSDITETKLLQQDLERLATTDRLTGVYNRMKYDEIVTMELERVKRSGKPFSLIMFDIDHFKEINDKYGHAAGDHALKDIADIAKEHIRKVDYLFRWGGEEFIILASDTDLERATYLAERMRGAIEEHSFDGVGKVTVSFGITKHSEGDTTDTLIKRVDAAMYKAKINGRNRVEIIIP